ncbi:hypothetical protein MASR2M17_08720 [Aminivibrio sp.]
MNYLQQNGSVPLSHRKAQGFPVKQENQKRTEGERKGRRALPEGIKDNALIMTDKDYRTVGEMFFRPEIHGS